MRPERPLRPLTARAVRRTRACAHFRPLRIRPPDGRAENCWTIDQRLSTIWICAFRYAIVWKPAKSTTGVTDRDGKYPALFDAVLADAGITTVLTGVRVPRMNAAMERWVRTCRRELLDRRCCPIPGAPVVVRDLATLSNKD